jgi:transglutaminase-like putative cysteine protease
MSNRTRVRVEKTEQYRVFPVSWAWYEHNPIEKVKITNGEPNAITDVSLSFYIESFMGQPWTFASLPRIGAGETVEIPVTALFNEVLINLTENTNAAGVVRIQYRSLGAKKESSAPVQMPIFHRNAFSWEDDRRAAAFVSPRDSSVRVFSRYVASALEGQKTAAGAPQNVRYAAAMFEALRLYGISYVVVPATSYKNISGNEAALDNVSYPYQALYYRGGDCTYLSILYCSLLEALDIETAFITIPGHLYLAFEVGDNNWQKDSRDIIELNGKRWLPVEITVPGEGFTRAWRIGAGQWRRYGEEAALYPIRDAWKLYPPVTVPASGDHPPEMPEAVDIVRAMEAELRKQ